MLELKKAIQQMKNEKAPGTDSLAIEFWKIVELKDPLLKFCNASYRGQRPTEWIYQNQIIIEEYVLRRPLQNL